MSTILPSSRRPDAAASISESELQLQRRRSTIGIGNISKHHPVFIGVDPAIVELVLKNVKKTDRDGDGKCILFIVVQSVLRFAQPPPPRDIFSI